MERVTNFDDTIFAENVAPENDTIKFPREYHKSSGTSNASNTKTSRKPKEKKVSKSTTYKDFSFDLFGDTFDVHFKDKVYSSQDKEHWIYGNSNYANLVINLSTLRPNGDPLLPSQIKQTFIHEVVHMLLESGQFFDESYNEALVEWIAKCINKMCPTIMSKF